MCGDCNGVSLRTCPTRRLNLRPARSLVSTIFGKHTARPPEMQKPELVSEPGYAEDPLTPELPLARSLTQDSLSGKYGIHE